MVSTTLRIKFMHLIILYKVFNDRDSAYCFIFIFCRISLYLYILLSFFSFFEHAKPVPIFNYFAFIILFCLECLFPHFIQISGSILLLQYGCKGIHVNLGPRGKMIGLYWNILKVESQQMLHNWYHIKAGLQLSLVLLSTFLSFMDLAPYNLPTLTCCM